MELKIEHVVILHENLARKTSDKYLLNIAHAYQHLGHKVTLIIAHGNPKELIQEFQFLEHINFKFSGYWIPRTFFGFFRKTMSMLKAIWMALGVVLHPPMSGRALILTDSHTVALCIFRYLTNHRLFYYENFKHLRNSQEVCEHTCFMPTLHQAKFMKMADCVIVENALFSDIYTRSFPALKKPRILYRSVDVDRWLGPQIDIKRIIPDIDDDFVMILCINKYKKSSNFKLTMDAFELLLRSMDSKKSRPYHLVIAGNCKNNQEELHYDYVVASAKTRKCGTQMTILKTLPSIHEKSLIENASVVMNCSRADTQADVFLKALCLGKPIVATNRGIATKIIKNRITGVLVEPEAHTIAIELSKLLATPCVSTFMGEIAKECFSELYSFGSLCKQLKALDCSE